MAAHPLPGPLQGTSSKEQDHLHKTVAHSKAFIFITNVIFGLWTAISMIVCTTAEIFLQVTKYLIIVHGICCNLCHDYYSQSKIADSLSSF